MSGDNPLLVDDFAIPFDRIEPSHVVPGVTTLLGAALRPVAQRVDRSEP